MKRKKVVKYVVVNTNPNVSQNDLSKFDEKVKEVEVKVQNELPKIGNVLVNDKHTSNVRGRVKSKPTNKSDDSIIDDTADEDFDLSDPNNLKSSKKKK